tara:strand:+ start:2484 stop:2651 length:168 start_codon:yes stop_codon:yes gene_type:complete
MANQLPLNLTKDQTEWLINTLCELPEEQDPTEFKKGDLLRKLNTLFGDHIEALAN